MDVAVVDPDLRTALRTAQQMVIARMDQLEGPFRKKSLFPVQNMFKGPGNDQKKFMKVMPVFRKEVSIAENGTLQIVGAGIQMDTVFYQKPEGSFSLEISI